MHPLEAHVKNGRLTLDEPTDLPELHAELEVSIAGADAGQPEDFATVLAELRQRP